MTSSALGGMQGALLFQSAVAVGAEVQQLVLTLPRSMSTQTIRRAFEEVARRHVMFRTTLSLEGAVTHTSTEVPFETVSLGVSLAETLPRFLASDRARSLDPSKLPVFRLTALRGVDRQALVWTFHHAHLDGRSIELVLDEVLAVARGSAPSDEPPDPWLHASAALEPERMRLGREHFARELGDVVEATPMPLEPSRGISTLRETKTEIPATSLLPLAALGEPGFTWATVMHAAWALTLAQRANRPTWSSAARVRIVIHAEQRAHRRLPDQHRLLRVELDPEARGRALGAWLRDVTLELRAVEHAADGSCCRDDSAQRGELMRDAARLRGPHLDERMHARHPGSVTSGRSSCTNGAARR
ncbi:MAG: hypothetical protein H6723_19370 [Sandaracinus sp.]|nr:hypothetical protein [Sandaracinus sp.]